MRIDCNLTLSDSLIITVHVHWFLQSRKDGSLFPLFDASTEVDSSTKGSVYAGNFGKLPKSIAVNKIKTSKETLEALSMDIEELLKFIAVIVWYS